MGCFHAKSSQPKTQPKIVYMVGLASAGKTTILNRLKDKELYNNNKHTTHNKIHQIEHANNCKFVAWDIQEAPLPDSFWTACLQHCDALICVIDSSEVDEILRNKKYLTQILACSEINTKPMLIWANKKTSTQTAAISLEELAEILQLNRLFFAKEQRNIVNCNAIGGQGIQEGLDWIQKALGIKTEQEQE